MIGQADQCPPPPWFPCFTLPWAMNRRQHTPHRVSVAPGHDGGARRDGTGRSGPVPRELRPCSRRRVDTRTYLKITIRGHGSSKHDGSPLIFMTSKFCPVAQMQWNPILRQVHLLVLHTAPQPFHEHVVHPSPLAVPADGHSCALEHVGERRAGELRTFGRCLDLPPVSWAVDGFRPCWFWGTTTGKGRFALVPGVGDLPRGWFGTSSCIAHSTRCPRPVFPRC